MKLITDNHDDKETLSTYRTQSNFYRNKISISKYSTFLKSQTGTKRSINISLRNRYDNTRYDTIISSSTDDAARRERTDMTQKFFERGVKVRDRLFLEETNLVSPIEHAIKPCDKSRSRRPISRSGKKSIRASNLQVEQRLGSALLKTNDESNDCRSIKK